MTYRELLKFLLKASEEQLDADISIIVDDEFREVSWICESDGSDVIDDGHILICVTP